MPGLLLAGRNQVPLTDDEKTRATNMFLGLDNAVNVRYEAGSRSIFHVVREGSGTTYGEIVFGPDIYPGTGVVDANSMLSLRAAAAHELTHYYRWQDKRALGDAADEHLDEALTSLEAVSRYRSELNSQDTQQLISDAYQRLCLYLTARARP